MKEFKKIRFSVEGHTDSSGSKAYNLKLSRERAEAVVEYLKSHGIEEWRLYSKGFGEEKPITTNKTALGRSLNRRVEIKALDPKEK